jgi:hypothetical protein
MLEIRLIPLYYRICHYYTMHLSWQVQRFSPNSFKGRITDEELLTTCLFCVADEEKAKIKGICGCTQNHWLDHFPALPSYQTFGSRLNRLSDCLPLLVGCLLEELPGQEQALQLSLLDSVPVMT